MAKKEKGKYDDILSKYGKDILVSKEMIDSAVTRTSSGSLLFDKALGFNTLGEGGYPRGKIIELAGQESSGKSTLCLHAIAEFQKRNLGDVLLIDGEYSFDSTYAKAIGVDIDSLLLSQPSTLEEAYNLTLDMVKTGNVGLVIIDSHTSLPGKRRLDNEIGKDEVALEPRIHSEGLKMLKSVFDKYNCSLIGVTQMRAKVGSMFGGSQGTGGNAWKFYSDIRVNLFRRTNKEKGEDMVNIEVVKNKTSIPYQKCEVPIAWGKGIDKVSEIVLVSLENGEVVKSGSWYYSKNKEANLAQGLHNLVDFLEDNPEYLEQLKQKAEKFIYGDIKQDT